MTLHREERKFITREFQRMGFDKDSRWRISDINKDFDLCNTYPRFLIVPSKFKDEDLESVAKFRYFRRIPTAVWRHSKNGCFIVRSSQPTVGWFGWFRSELDEGLLQSFIDNTLPQQQLSQSISTDNTPSVITKSDRQEDETIENDSESRFPAHLDSRMLIIDARSYTAAMANRAKGGGCECSEYYQRCEVHFMNLANIHSIRKSYHAIRSVCEAYSEQSNNWLTFLDNTRWLHHISGLLKSALLVVDAIDIDEKSVMIHCSDGWDRTAQLVALAEIMLDSHYRTFDGFRTLIQREWLDFGHKFADRCGSNSCNDDPNERCPVFLQWLDCVQQLLVQFPKHFEFDSTYLDKLNRHTYSNVFGTFSYNSNQERAQSQVEEKAPCLWAYFESSRDRYKNENYIASEDILRPSFKVRDLHFWKEVYLPPIKVGERQLTSVTSTSSLSISNNQQQIVPGAATGVDSGKCCDSLHMDGPTRTVCK